VVVSSVVEHAAATSATAMAATTRRFLTESSSIRPYLNQYGEEGDPVLDAAPEILPA
jgi:hypothetical protein